MPGTVKRKEGGSPRPILNPLHRVLEHCRPDLGDQVTAELNAALSTRRTGTGG